jgi:para-nitrobenzyl esterase
MADVRVTTTAGDLRGAEIDGIKVFKGVPYAAPPMGPNRWRPPQPVAPWSGVRDALDLPPSCPQPTQRPTGWSQEQATSEDCLYLNVWTPGLGDGRRPVMVWIHGGGYSIGSGSWPLYDGAALARRGDVVVVTVNHRLGPFGYLHLGELAGDDYAASGNNGQLDLVAVLEWVRDNVGGFGGDPGNVTVFGESGGGAKISTLLAMPPARGLFHRAAIQSGPGVRVGSVEGGTKAARALLDNLGITDVGELWSVPADKLLSATSGGMGRGGFRPVLDGTVVTGHPAEALADGTATDVPVLIGCNRDESAGALPAELDDAGLRERLAVFGADRVDEIVDVYRNAYPDIAPLDLLSYVLTDSRMRAGSITLAEAKVKGTASPVFMYFFTYAMAGRAGHGYEIQFVFDNVREPVARPSASRQQLADVMSEAWLAFARDGDPGHAGMAKWPGYSPPERATMIFGRDDCEVVDDPDAAARELWSTARR